MTKQHTRFAEISGLDPRLVAVLERRSLTHAFPVQAAVIPAALDGRDLLVQSPTGSGKTLAFGLPIIERLERGLDVPSAVILVPTRELAVQVADDLKPIATGKQLRVVAVFGGTPIHQQAKQAKDAAIVVATPGRLEDLLRTRKIDLRAVRVLVLDEADRMLDMGFQPQVDAIAARLPKTRQTMLFSATLEGRVAQVTGEYTSDPVTVTTEAVPGAGGKIEHVVWQTTGGTKVDTVLEALETKRDLAVVFVRTKRSAETLMERMRTFGVRATAIHGGMTQRERLREYDRFQKTQCDVLVATDVFARGMDLDRITLVINYDLPEDADTYRHRVGRTGRAGRTGTAITMMTSSQRKVLRRMFREAEVALDAFDDVRITKRTRRQPLPDAQHFVPTDKPKSAAPKHQHGRPDPRRGARPQRDRKPAPSYGKQRGARGETGGGGAGGGSIITYNATKGFGFIKPERGGADVFFHRDALSGVDPHAIRRGTRVAFSARSHKQGMRAHSVQLMDS